MTIEREFSSNDQFVFVDGHGAFSGSPSITLIKRVYLEN